MLTHDDVLPLIHSARSGSTGAPLEIFIHIRDALRTLTESTPPLRPGQSSRVHLEAAYEHLIAPEHRSPAAHATFLAIGATAVRHLLTRDLPASSDRAPVRDPLPALQTAERVLREGVAVQPRHEAALLMVDRALDRLEQRWQKPAEVFEGRLFGQMADEELATAHCMTVATVRRCTSLGRWWLRREVQRNQPALFTRRRSHPPTQP